MYVGIGAACTENTECLVGNSQCENLKDGSKTCQCKKGYVHFEDDCHKEGKFENISNHYHIIKNLWIPASEINEDCTIDEQCKPLLGTCTDSKCQCKPSQHFSSNKCEEQKGESFAPENSRRISLWNIILLGLGEECARAGECYMPQNPESVECRNSMCQCKIGYKSERNICTVRSKKSEYH